ncbi:c-type cytochrome [Psychromarinibacter sp. S121]|uniref:c-type cytochrome n=1 Tax=Psychromarinibacter sp. S121 TaxID=3415127 RepID=UPI003C7D2D5E
MIPAALAIGVASAALAHTGATGIVKERMVAMSAMGDAVKAIAPMMSGEAAYDAEVVREAAELIGSHAGSAMTELFPENNENAASYVKDAIWEDWDTFTELAERLHTYSEGLALAADNGLASSRNGMADAGAMMGGDAMMGSGDMMGGSGMMADATMGREELAEMPADAVFAMVSETCSSCHTRFRTEAK